MKYVIALALASAGLSPAMATHWDAINGWDVSYGEDMCDARTTINGTTLMLQYTWTDDTMAIGFGNHNWALPKENVAAELSFNKIGGSATKSYAGELHPDLESNAVTMRAQKGTEIVIYLSIAMSVKAALTDGTVVADLPLEKIKVPMASLLSCIRERRVANPFVKPAPMMNEFAKDGEFK